MQRAVLMDKREIVIEEVSIPQIGPGEVLIKNKVSTTRGTDVKIYMRGYPLLKPPHPFGHGFSGVIAAVGEASWGLRRRSRRCAQLGAMRVVSLVQARAVFHVR